MKSTKIIVSDTGESPHLKPFNTDLQDPSFVNQISNHPVMIKAVSKNPASPFDESEGVIEETENENLRSDIASDLH